MLTLELVQEQCPKGRKVVTQSMVDRINTLMQGEPEELERYRENIVGFGHILKAGSIAPDAYMNAVRFVTYRLFNLTVVEAWQKTFPERYAQYVAKGTDKHRLSQYAYTYNRGKLVTQLIEQAMVPVHIVNADKFQSTVNIMYGILADEKVSARDRVAAGASLLKELRPPEKSKIEIDVTHKAESSFMDDLRATTQALVNQQKSMMEAGIMSAKSIIEADFVEVRDGD